MRFYRRTLIITLIFVLAYSLTYGQNGPAGVGNYEGNNGQPKNILWLNAQELGLNDGNDVTTWPDISGNSHDMTTAGSDPSYVTGLPQLNNYNVVRFDSSNNETLEFYSDFNTNNGIVGQNYTFFYVASRRNTNSENYVFGGENINTTNGNLYSGWGEPLDGSNNPSLVSGQWNNDAAASWGTFETDSANEFGIVSSILNTSDDRYLYENGLQVANAGNANPLTGQALTKLAYKVDRYWWLFMWLPEDHFYNVDIAEMIFFNTNLNSSQKLIIENYLSEKYQIALQGGVDYYSNSDYNKNVIGIGTYDGTTKHSETSGNGGGLYLEEYNNTLDNPQEFIMAGHDGTPHGQVNAEVSVSDTSRWQRIWYIQKTTTDAAGAKIMFKPQEAGFGPPTEPDDYRLLYRSGTTGDFTPVNLAEATIDVDNRIVFNVPDSKLQTGYYTLGVPAYRDWYTLISGNWDSTYVWTLDPSGALPNNPNGYTPSTSPTSNFDKVHILTSKSITVDRDNIAVSEVTVDGRLELGTTSGHNFGSIKGSGRIILEADNFPAGDATHFVTQGQGEGTVVYTGGSYDLAKNRTFYNVEVELDNSANTVTLLSDYTLNGDFRVTNGSWRINDNTSISRNMTVNGDLTVDENGVFDVGPAAVNHQLTILGDMTINGEAYFTNRTLPIQSSYYTNEDNTGVTKVYFTNDEKNQKLICNGPAYFSQITINKGIDKTYILDVSATDNSYFQLLGHNDELVTGSPGSRDGNKALRLLAGTVRLGSNIIIPNLATQSQFDVDEDARLWLDGAEVSIPASGSIYDWFGLYGTLRISDNSVFNLEAEYGIIIRSNGTVKVEGGTAYINSLRTSIWGASGDHVGAYIQSGGDVYITNEDPNTDFATFHLPYSSNVFQMSGGNLYIQDQGNGGDTDDYGFIIASSKSNSNVTGGNVILDMQFDVPYDIISRAPFWNFTVRNATGGTQNVTLRNFTDPDGDLDDVVGYPFTVLNDFTIEGSNGVTFDANSVDVEVGGDFTLETNATYTPGTNTTNFIGADSSYIYVNENTSSAPLTFHNLTIEKEQRTNPDLFWPVTLGNTGRTEDPANANNTAIQIQNNLLIKRGRYNTFRYKTELLDSLEIVDGKIHADATNPGRIVLNAASPAEQTIKGAVNEEQYFGNIELNNDSTKLLSDVNLGNLYLNSGVFKIQEYNLTVNNSITTTGTYSSNLMIRGAGNASDGGLTLPFDLQGDYGDVLVKNYPMGVGSLYTPVDIYCNASGISTTGQINITPVDTIHPTTKSGNENKTIPYFWRVKHIGLNSITNELRYTFTYPANIPNPVNDAAVLWNEDFQWYTPGSVNDPYLEYPYSEYLTGDFTAGNASVFNKPRTLYSIGSGNFNNKNTWSEDGHNDGATNQPPASYDYCIIGGSGGVNHNVMIASNNIAVSKVYIKGKSETGITAGNPPTLEVQSGTTGHSLTEVDGNGRFVMNDNVLPSADYGSFVKSDSAIFEYNGGTYTLPSELGEYPNLQIRGNVNNAIKTLPSQNIYVNNNLLINDPDNTGISLQLDNAATNADLEIADSLIITNQGNFIFPATGSKRTVEVHGTVDMNYMGEGSVNNLIVEDGISAESDHELLVHSDINTGNSFITFWRADNKRKVNMKFVGDNSSTITDGTPDGVFNIQLNRILANKTTGKDIIFNEEFALNGSSNGTSKALQLNSGNFITNNANTDITLSSGGDDFSIPQKSSFQINQGIARVSGLNTGILLDGLLKIEGNANVYCNQGTNNYIEYSASGNAEIDIYQGTLHVGSAIRRSLYSQEGILKFTQNNAASDIVIGTDNLAPESNRGVFEILNDGSEFNQLETGAMIKIATQQNNPSVASLYLDPASNNLADATGFIIGDDSTDTDYNIGVYSSIPLKRLRVDTATAKLWSIPLTIENELKITSNSGFNANGLDLIINGDFINKGSFISNKNNTYFTGSGTQNILGATTFYNLIKDTGNDTLKFSSSEIFSVENNLEINSGLVQDSGSTIYVKGDVNNDGVHISSISGQGIYMNGSLKQTVTGNGTFGKLTIDNALDIEIPTNNILTISNALRLKKGVFDIGKNLLIVQKDADIEQINAFSDANMIQTNISFTDAGVRRYIPSGAFLDTIPIGSEGKYTPVIYDITNSSATDAYLRVKSANEPHPSVQEDSETPEIIDQENVLQYYWTLESSGLTDFSGEIKMRYRDEDVMVDETYYTVSDYITARLLSDGSGQWNKYDVNSFDETNNLLRFTFSNTDDDNISGDYTGGIDDAIPDQVPIYHSIQNGNWSDNSTWQEDIAGGPRGAIVIISDTVDVTTNYLVSYTTRIESNGQLNIFDTYGHRLGNLTGQGTLYLERGDMPAAVYDEFVVDTGGTFHFSGTTSYDILSEFTEVNNLTFSGTGQRRMPNIDLDIHGDILVDGDDNNLSLINEYDRTWYLEENFTLRTGGFDAGIGINSKVVFDGLVNQVLRGDFMSGNSFNYVELDNSSDLLALDSVGVDEQLVLTDGLVTLPDTGVVTLYSLATDALVGANSSRYIRGALRKKINKNDGYAFEVGDTNRYGRLVISNNTSPSSADFWEAQYYNNNPHPTYDTSSYASPLESVSGNEYWRVKGPSGVGTSDVTIRWDAASVLPAETDDRANNLHIAEWMSGTSQWESVGNLVSDFDVNSGTVTTDPAVNLEEHIFTLASEESQPKPTARFITPDTAVCEGSTIQLVIELTGDSDWTIEVDEAGTINTYTVTSSPYTLSVTNNAVAGDAGSYTINTVTDINGVTGNVYGDPVTVTVNPLPTIFDLTGGGNICANETTELILDGSEVGVEYELFRDGISQIIVSGTGSPISFGDYSQGGAYTVEAVNSTSGCTETMNGTSIAIDPTPDPEPYTDTNPVCYDTGINIPVYSQDINGVGDTYFWSPADSLDNASAENPNYQPSDNPNAVSISTWFKVTVSNSVSGCSAVDSVQIELLRQPETGNQYYVPNEFDQN